MKKLFLLSLLAGIFYACKDVYEVEVPSETSSFSIADARNWFEANAPSAKSGGIFLRSGDEEPVEEPAPVPILNWNLAEMSRDSLWEVVELPWKYEEIEEIFALGEVWEHALANNTTPESVIRLVVMQHRETGATYGFRMKIAPTLDYLQRNGANLHSNMYLNRDSNLSGVVMFYTLRGQFLNGWRYVDGEIVSEIIGVAPRNQYIGGGRPCNLGEVVIGKPLRPIVPEFVPNRLEVQEKKTDVSECIGRGGGGGGGGGANTGAPTVNIDGSIVVTMGDLAGFSARLTPNYPVTGVVFQMARNVQNLEFRDVQSAPNLALNMPMRNPGRWAVRAQVTITRQDNIEVVLTSPVHIVDVQFPDISTFKNIPAIRAAMRAAWAQTKVSANTSGRQEYGFWIYADSRGNGNLDFSAGTRHPGGFVSGCLGTNASISTGGLSESPGNPFDPRSGGRFAVAFFHTHTPLTFCPRYTPCGRFAIGREEVGPSQSDRDWADSRGMPGLVYDYVIMHFPQYGFSGLIGGHYINADARVTAFGPSRRRVEF